MNMKFSLGDAIDALKPGPIFRRAVMLYADRKFFLIATFHIVITVVVGGKKQRSIQPITHMVQCRAMCINMRANAYIIVT